jgi:hypothetical protein
MFSSSSSFSNAASQKLFLNFLIFNKKNKKSTKHSRWISFQFLNHSKINADLNTDEIKCNVNLPKM